ncbi:NAD(P)-dependent oxidoreductase [Luteimicrobium subarcticum]|uniref:3-hydroxyisobutyrate dehydrogenase n=1 Tax=Luteimicrobium subarcticum TaxID=620910 RepID=A0A2M8WQU0_9MICO|nr:NAD(P)-dependent oxidoreductase [Luteimicrobium subarcticum]PJI93309.1 3-hydroxyisobutyrate dehydrogenase [Luteimicrobium subarcticum]
MNITVLGTGIMGSALTGTLRRAGHDVTVWNRTRERADRLLETGAGVADTPATAVAQADVVLSVVFDADSVLDVLEEAAPALPAGAVWGQATTVGADGTHEIAVRAAELGVPLVETQLVGTKGPAEHGALTILTAGDPALVDKARPALDAISAKVLHAGDELGQATALKLACNAWISALTVGMAQALSIATAQGLDGHLVLDAIEGGPADSQFARIKAGAMLSGDLTPSFRLDTLRKDVGLMIEVARATGTTATMLDALSRLLGVASLDGHGRHDIAAVYDAFTNTPLGSGD